MNWIKKIYHQIPLSIRYHIGSFLWSCKHFFNKHINPFYPVVYLIEGVEKTSQSPLAFAFAGCLSPIQEYWTNRTLEPNYQRRCLGRHFFLSVRPLLKKTSSCSFVLMENSALTSYVLSQNPGFLIPSWVDMEINISDDLKEFNSSQGRSIKSRIAKNHLSYTVTRDIHLFKDFYERMYLPYVKNRHSSCAEIYPYSFLQEIFLKGELLLVKEGTQTLGGGLFFMQEGQIKCQALGILEGKWEYVEKGTAGAFYYFLMSEMKKRGLHKLHMGGTRPFLGDGVTKFKTAIKAQFMPNCKNSGLWLSLLRDTAALRNFLTNNPFICLDEHQGLYRTLFIQADSRLNPETITQEACSALKQGLKGTRVIVFGALQMLHDNFLPSDLPSLHIKPACNFFNPWSVE